MPSNYKEQVYNVDFALCIDATGSMSPCIDMVKANASRLYNDFMQKAASEGKVINSVRIRIIAFRDYRADGNQAMLATNFFHLPEDTAKLQAAIDSIFADGGGDDPEDGLEALAFAIRSAWVKPEPGVSKCRQVIVVWTDAPIHPIGFSRTTDTGEINPVYPTSMPKTFRELTNWWDGQGAFVDSRSKRLLLYAPGDNDIPNAVNWSEIANNWENVIYVPSKAGAGLAEASYDEIIKLLVKTC